MRRTVAEGSALGRAAAIAERGGVSLIGTRSVQELPWQYPICDAERRCFVGHLPGALDARKAKRMMDFVLDGMEPVGWDQPIRTMNGKVFKVHGRQACWLVAPGTSANPYSFGGPNVGQGLDCLITVKPKLFPSWMQEIMQAVMPLCGLDDPKDWPNCCSMNRYSGDATCDWHADDDEMFQATVRDTVIISLSLGAKRVFEFRRAGEITALHKVE